MSNPRAVAAVQRPPTRASGRVRDTPPKLPFVEKPVKASVTSSRAVKPANKPSNSRSSPSGKPLIGAATKPVPSPFHANSSQTSHALRQDNWLNRTVQNSIAGVGNYAGGLVNSIGGSVNKIGEGVGNQITTTTRYWGQGVAGYGNNIKDSVGVGGPRIATGCNPLGLAGQGISDATQTGPKPVRAAARKGKGGGANPLGLSER